MYCAMQNSEPNRFSVIYEPDMSTPFVEIAAPAAHEYYHSSTTKTGPPALRSRCRLVQRKLRSSCDGCGSAKVRLVQISLLVRDREQRGRLTFEKVKCDRGHPACARCVAQGLACVYGVSRKAGKPPRKQRAGVYDCSNPPASMVSAITNSGSETSRSSAQDGGKLDFDLVLNSMGNEALGLTLGDSPLSATGLGPSESCFPVDTFSNLWAFPSGGSIADEVMYMSAHTNTQMASASSPPTSVSPAVSCSPDLSSLLPPANSPPTSCIQRINHIMRRLYTADPITPVSDGIFDLDSMPVRSGDIVEPLQKLLDCSCVLSPHMAILYASILSTLLLWYRQAAWSGRTPWAEEEFKASSEKTESSAGKGSFSAIKYERRDRSLSLVQAHVLGGTFPRGDQDLQAALTSCHVLSELRTVSGLIDTFVSLGMGRDGCGKDAAFRHRDRGRTCCAATSAYHDDTGADSGGLFASLGAWLRAEHGDVVKKARSGLAVLDEGS